MGHKKGKLVTQPIMWPFLLKDLDSCQNKASHITPFMRLETFFNANFSHSEKKQDFPIFILRGVTCNIFVTFLSLLTKICENHSLLEHF